MRRIDKILSWSLSEEIVESYGIEAAYCACLGPVEACELLLLAAVGRVDLRAAALRKVSADMESGISKCHLGLVNELLKLLESVDAKGRQSVGYCLSSVAALIGGRTRHKVEAAFLDSKYITVRRRGYKSIGHNPKARSDLILRAWKRYSDVECAWIITKTFPCDFLVKNRSALEACFTQGWQFSRLYLRIGEARPDMLALLKERDPISYCYVRAKLQSAITLKEAESIIDRVSGDERFGLLVWSLGRMKLWKALEYVEQKLAEIQNGRLAALRERYKYLDRVETPRALAE